MARSAEIVTANAADVAKARESGTPEAMIDRLSLDAGRIEAIAQAVRQVADLPDPVGEVVRGSTLPNGLELRQLRVPLGVVEGAAGAGLADVARAARRLVRTARIASSPSGNRCP